MKLIRYTRFLKVELTAPTASDGRIGWETTRKPNSVSFWVMRSVDSCDNTSKDREDDCELHCFNDGNDGGKSWQLTRAKGRNWKETVRKSNQNSFNSFNSCKRSCQTKLDGLMAAIEDLNSTASAGDTRLRHSPWPRNRQTTAIHSLQKRQRRRYRNNY